MIVSITDHCLKTLNDLQDQFGDSLTYRGNDYLKMITMTTNVSEKAGKAKSAAELDASKSTSNPPPEEKPKGDAAAAAAAAAAQLPVKDDGSDHGNTADGDKENADESAPALLPPAQPKVPEVDLQVTEITCAHTQFFSFRSSAPCAPSFRLIKRS
jgi:hypothetical protein